MRKPSWRTIFFTTLLSVVAALFAVLLYVWISSDIEYQRAKAAQKDLGHIERAVLIGNLRLASLCWQQWWDRNSELIAKFTMNKASLQQYNKAFRDLAERADVPEDWRLPILEDEPGSPTPFQVAFERWKIDYVIKRNQPFGDFTRQQTEKIVRKFDDSYRVNTDFMQTVAIAGKASFGAEQLHREELDERASLKRRYNEMVARIKQLCGL